MQEQSLCLSDVKGRFTLMVENSPSPYNDRNFINERELAGSTRNQSDCSQKIFVTGSGGLIGSALAAFLVSEGYTVNRLVRDRTQTGADSVYWNPSENAVDLSALEGCVAVIHLAGENIAGGRWSEERKKRIRDSRIHGTRFLSESLVRLTRPPGVLICASAIGYYGHRGEEILEETSLPGKGFLAGVCREWETAARPAAQKGIRVVNLRIGVVLTPNGGALVQMLLPFRMGFGGVIGNGKQFMSWITLDDLLGVIHHVLTMETLAGPINAVAPNPVTNREFTKTLGAILKRPTLIPFPAFAARIALGEMAGELLLASTRVIPARLLDSGYRFRHPDLKTALTLLLGKTAR